MHSGLSIALASNQQGYFCFLCRAALQALLPGGCASQGIQLQLSVSCCVATACTGFVQQVNKASCNVPETKETQQRQFLLEACCATRCAQWPLSLQAVVFVAVCTGFVQQVNIPASRPGGQTQPARTLFDQLASEQVHIHLLQFLASNVCGSVCCCLPVVLLLVAQGLCSTCTQPDTGCSFCLVDCNDQNRHVEAHSQCFDIIVCLVVSINNGRLSSWLHCQ